MTNTTLIVNKNASWYTQVWPWILILLPGSVVVASTVTIFIAVQGADSLVSDDYYKQGKLINKNLSKIEYAKKIGLTGELILKDNVLHIKVSAKNESIKLPPVLNLFFSHPTTASKDFSTILIESVQVEQRSDGLLVNSQYTSKKNTEYVSLLSQGAWYVSLQSLDQSWQLKGKIKNNIKNIPLNAD